jgi:hypothetical protein
VSETLLYIREAGAPADRWCPAEGVQVRDDVYRVTRIPEAPALEFAIGDHVRCATRGFPDGSEALLAIAKVPAP